MATKHTIHDNGITGQIDTYNDAVEMAETARLLLLARTADLTMDGHLP
jgi:hypothetical protein